MQQIIAEVVIDISAGLLEAMKNDPMPTKHKKMYYAFLSTMNSLLDKYSLDCSALACKVVNGKVKMEYPANECADADTMQRHIDFLFDASSYKNDMFLELLDALVVKAKKQALETVRNGYFMIEFSKQPLDKEINESMP